MIRDLHPHTKPQRAASPDNVSPEARRLGFEPSDWPSGKVGLGLVAGFAILLLIFGGIGLLLLWGGPEKLPISAEDAVARFETPAPALGTGPVAEGPIEEAGLPGRQRSYRPGIGASDDAMRRAAASGWNDGGLQ